MKSFAFTVAALAFTPIVANAGIYNTGTWRPYLTSDLGVTYTDAKMHGYDMSGFTGVFNIGAGMRNDRARIGITYQKRDTISELFSSWITETNASLDEQAVMATVSYDIISAGWFGMYGNCFTHFAFGNNIGGGLWLYIAPAFNNNHTTCWVKP